MTARPKSIGTAAESAVVRHCRANGFDGAERLALHGTLDEGDATLCPGVGAEIKAGKAAENASDQQVALWLEETRIERHNRGADFMPLILKRKGKGAASVGQWWAYLPGIEFVALALLTVADPDCPMTAPLPAVRITLDECLRLLRRAGYGTEL